MRRLPQVLDQRQGRRQVPRRLRRGAPAGRRAEEEALAGTGRVLLRKSGTEPLVRVMVEAGEQEQAQAVADRLVEVVRARLSL